jgi:predicted dehydrogenase
MDQTGCRIAILGLDHRYSALACIPTLARDPRIKIAGIAHHQLARAQKVASDSGVERVVAEPAALLEDKSIDAVAIFTRTDRVPGLCIAAAQAGKHILTIKPLSARLTRPRPLSAQCGRRECVCCRPKGSASGAGGVPSSSMVSEGRLGEIAFARCSVSAGLPWSWPDDPKPGWFVDPARCGGWIDHTIYQIDRLRWILGGEVEFVRGNAPRLATRTCKSRTGALPWWNSRAGRLRSFATTGSCHAGPCSRISSRSRTPWAWFGSISSRTAYRLPRRHCNGAPLTAGGR